MSDKSVPPRLKHMCVVTSPCRAMPGVTLEPVQLDHIGQFEQPVGVRSVVPAGV